MNFPKKVQTTALAMLAIAAMSASAQTTTPKTTTEADAASHLLNKVEPVYPAIAKAAHLQGEVVLMLTVSETGDVVSVKTVSGPPMLVSNAIDAAKKYKYTPFTEDGKPVRANIQVTMTFSLGIPDDQYKTDQAIGQKYFPQADKCRAALKSDPQSALAECGLLLEIARKFPVEKNRPLEIMNAHQYMGHAYLMNQMPDKALPEEEEAARLAGKYLKKSESEYAVVIFWRATVERALRMEDKSLEDYQQAENSMRQAIKNLPDLKSSYTKTLVAILRQHADYLDSLNRQSEADVLRKEAASL